MACQSEQDFTSADGAQWIDTEPQMMESQARGLKERTQQRQGGSGDFGDGSDEEGKEGEAEAALYVDDDEDPNLDNDEGKVTEKERECESDSVKWTSDGYMACINELLKPAMSDSDKACTGKTWVNGGATRATEPQLKLLTLSFQVKISYEERGHGLTRTVLFGDPLADATVSLRIRWRYASESYV